MERDRARNGDFRLEVLEQGNYHDLPNFRKRLCAITKSSNRRVNE